VVRAVARGEALHPLVLFPSRPQAKQGPSWAEWIERIGRRQAAEVQPHQQYRESAFRKPEVVDYIIEHVMV
jgi:hypothetical protein